MFAATSRRPRHQGRRVGARHAAGHRCPRAAVEPTPDLEDAFTGNNALAFTPDGRLLATVVDNGSSWSVRLWNTITGQPVRNLPTEAPGVSAVAISPDGTTVVSGTGWRPVIICSKCAVWTPACSVTPSPLSPAALHDVSCRPPKPQQSPTA
ncbi:WD40 repeat domain-containing protein [Streptomyces poriticola]|uniref:WD40 repeat domain-containing protein n=1 Tax=Streptomyces poriticola TaxID=3120506 RepID=UPI0038CD3DF9